MEMEYGKYIIQQPVPDPQPDSISVYYFDFKLFILITLQTSSK